jgi:hypothetical protein
MGRTAATIAVIAILGVAALGAARYAAEAAKPGPAAATSTQGDDMLLLQKPSTKLDETPRDAAGKPLHLETATFALG